MVRHGPAAALFTLSMLLVQPVLALGTEGPAPAAAGRFVPGGAVVLFDEAHFPVYTVNPDNPCGLGAVNQPRGAYAAYAKVLENAGHEVRTLDYGYSLDSDHLSGVKVLVIACSRCIDSSGSVSVPYTNDELDAIAKFVQNGGGLFLVGDHTDFPPAILPIAEQFGIEFGQKLLHDPVLEHHVQNATSGQPTDEGHDVFIVFERSRGNFGDHPIMQGLDRVELYRTDIFDALPADAVPLITSDSDTYYYDGTNSYVQAPNEVVSAAIPSNGTAGAGRIVVVGDTNTFETDENRDDEDADLDLFDSDNELYGLQIVEWLSEVPEHFGVELSSAEEATFGLHSVQHNVTAGNLTSFRLRLENTGNGPDIFDLQVSYQDSNRWPFGLTFSDVRLNNSEIRDLSLTVRVPPEAEVDDLCRLGVTARSRTAPSTSSSVNCTIRVPPVHELTLTCPGNRKSVSPGEEARYELLLANRGNLWEKVGIRAEAPEGWEAQLDVENQKLAPGEQSALNLSIIPPAGALGGTEGKVTVSAVCLDFPEFRALNDTYTTLLQEFAFRLSCPFPEQGVDPGSLVSFPVSITNLGNGNDEVALSLAGGGRWTAYLQPSQLWLPHNSTLQVAAVARAPPLAPANEVQELTLLAVSVQNSSARDSLSLRCVVNRINKFILEINPGTRYVDPGKRGEFDLTVTNIGNTPETVRLYADSPGILPRTELALGIGESGQLPLAVPVGEKEVAWTKHLINVTGVSTQNASVRRSAVAVVVVNQTHRLRGELAPERLSLPPGAEGQVNLTVQNEGNGPDIASASVDRSPPNWGAELAEPTLQLLYLGTGRTSLRVTPPGDALAGTYEIVLGLSDGAGAAQFLTLRIEVQRAHNFTALLRPESLSCLPGKVVSFMLRLENLGNGPERVAIWPTGPQARWIFPAESIASLEHSAGKEVSIPVSPDSDARPGRYQLTLAVRGEDNQTRELAFLLVVKEGPTSLSDLPCFIGIILILVAAACALLLRRRLLAAQGEAGLGKGPAGNGRKEAGEEGKGEPGSENSLLGKGEPLPDGPEAGAAGAKEPGPPGREMD